MVLGMGQVHSGTDAELGLFYERGKTLPNIRTTSMQTDGIQKRVCVSPPPLNYPTCSPSIVCMSVVAEPAIHQREKQQGSSAPTQRNDLSSQQRLAVVRNDCHWRNLD
jgi:hypothetical protein